MLFTRYKLKANSDLPIIEIVPHNDKLTRFYQIVPVIESGRVFLPQQAVWLNDFEYEILMFPEARYDDQVDSTVQYLQWTRKINTSAFNANSGLKENRKGRKQGKLSSYKKIDEVTHGRYNKTVLFGR